MYCSINDGNRGWGSAIFSNNCFNIGGNLNIGWSGKFFSAACTSDE